MSRRRLLASLVALLAAACGNDERNPFDQLSPSRPPADDAVLLFVSGSWSGELGHPRELFAVNADGSQVEKLTTCAQASPPCDFMSLSPSPDRARIAAVRTTPEAEPGTAALYFMDLGRSVQTLITDQRRVGGVDWSWGGSFLVFSATTPSGDEDLYVSEPNGDSEDVLWGDDAVQERSPRLNPGGSAVVFESVSEDARGAIAVFTGRDPVLLTPGGDVSQPLPGTPYFVGSDADPCYAPDGSAALFRRLTGTGNGGFGTWDLLLVASVDAEPTPVVSGGSVYRGAPDWGPDGIAFVEVDAASAEARLVVVQPDGTGRRVLRVEHAGYRMGSPRWLR